MLITGVYGSGKSSVAQEIAYLLEKRTAPYALLDLDFLGWFDASGEGGSTEHGVMLKNLAALVANYSAVGVRYFVLAGAIRDEAQLNGIKAELPMPLRVVRLTVPLAEIEARLRSDPTTGRREDIREAAAWVAGSVGVGIEDGRGAGAHGGRGTVPRSSLLLLFTRGVRGRGVLRTTSALGVLGSPSG